MYPVSAGFAAAVKGNRELTSSLTVNGVTYTGHLFNLQLDRLNQRNGQLIGNAVSQTMTIEGDVAMAIDDVVVFSLKLGTDTVPFTPMRVTECDYNERTRKYTITAHDALYFATNKVASAAITLPCTMADYLTALCSACGITPSSSNNYYSQAYTIDSVNLTGDETIATVIGYFAEATLTNAWIDRAGELRLVNVTDNTSQFSLGTAYTENVVQNVLTPDGVTLAREPVEGDDIMYPTNAVTPLRIVDNPFLDNTTSDAERLTKAIDIWDEIDGISFSGFDMSYRCNFALDPWDAWDFNQVDGTTVTTYFPGDTLKFSGGLSAKTSLEIIPQTRRAGTTSMASYLKEIYIKVDKANATIEQRIATVEEDITALENTIISNAQQTEITISQTGGYNLIRNSAFYKGADYWDVLGAYTVTMNTETERETESGTKISINNQVTQSGIKTIAGQVYTLAGSWDPSLTVTVNGSTERTFVATGDSTVTIAGTGSFWDMRLVKGDSSLAWTQHADEMYGRGVLIDNTGVTVRSLATDTTAVVDDDSFEVRDNGITVAELSADVVSSSSGVLTDSLQIGDNILVAYAAGKWMVTGA